MINLTLKGEPKSTNTIYRNHCKFGFPTNYMSKEGKSLKESYQWQIKSQYHGKPLLGSVKLTATLFFGTKRTQDIDNFNKLVLDALSGLVYEDDKQIQEMTVKKDYCKKNPRIELHITSLN